MDEAGKSLCMILLLIKKVHKVIAKALDKGDIKMYSLIIFYLVGSRPYIFLSGRVHPGESNSSWVMKGNRL